MIFNEDYGVGSSPPDNTQITTTLLYYSEEELAEFKKLCKAGMMAEYQEDRFKANVSNFILNLLRKFYGTNSVESSNDQQSSGTS